MIAADDLRQSLELATNTCFDLVILDYGMPHMNGAELTRQLKHHRCDLPAVLLSGHPSLPADAMNIIDEHAVKGESPELTPVSGNTRDSRKGALTDEPVLVFASKVRTLEREAMPHEGRP